MTVRRFFIFVSVATAVSTAISIADGGFWLSDLLANLRLHLLAACFVMLIYWAACRQLLASLAILLALAVNLGSVYRAQPEPTAAASTSDDALRVVTINVRQSNDAFGRVQDYLRTQPADVVVVQEVSPQWLDALTELEDTYPYRLAEPRADNFGIAMLSRRPPLRQVVHHFEAGGIPYIEMTMKIGDVPLTVLGVHLSWPVMPDAFRARNAQILELSEWPDGENERLLLCGDLNLTVWSDWFARLTGQGRFSNWRHRAVEGTTWPSVMRWGGLSIDHCLARSGSEVATREVGPSIGSDHLPVAFDIEVDAAN